ncbi:2-dehydro-3-deoxygalactonokinase [Sphingomonas sp. SRS2]|uniref:2-dehydro-3-deoxygalactonokinase n=1 Tax=Sphingomonas sp. SRS2 TaxID=133190 RepID=UPI0006184382|nr:2-dehydro-3-deoxygalactonokinase [Sphingomonas sp. SRS2]KKC24652.1 hypothetical protein WP12_18320 [Sphingomonas sp. SRS2]
MTPQGMIAVDWGTTNRRAYVIGPDGELIERFSDDQGVSSIAPGSFAAAITDLQARLGARQMLLAGMIGSNRGWIEAPYAPCPAGLPELVAGLKQVAEFNAAIVPGLRYSDAERDDVMRGEEVQLIGAVAAGLTPPDSLVCHPGTHAKWARVDNGSITAFRTVMTGELFALLKTHSILAAQMQAPATPNHSFIAGVRRSLEHRELTAELFGIRASSLLGRLADEDAGSYASGLLIGADIAAGLAFAGSFETVHLIGDPDLTALYSAALREAECENVQIDGETAFLAGICAMAECIW